MFGLSRITFLFLATVFIVNAEKLEIVNDDEILNLIRTEKYVVILFTKKNCEKCDNYENELLNLREDLVDSLNAWVVKAVSSPMVRLYDPDKEPAIVFFRHGVPLLYDGPINDELILHTFTNNKEPVVKELTDDNFEHLTQASSGATTGDWFVLFYSTECVECQRMQARWEAVGAKLKTRLNVARMNSGTTGAVTARRFDIYEVPAFILFRKGFMYRYEIPKYEVSSLQGFAQEWYKNVRAERVPAPKSPFDDLITMIAMFIKENPWLLQVGATAFVTGLIFSLIFSLRSAKKAEPKKKK